MSKTTSTPSSSTAGAPATSGSTLKDAQMPRTPRNWSDKVGQTFDNTLNRLYPERIADRQRKAKSNIKQLAGEVTEKNKTDSSRVAVDHKMDQELQVVVMQKLSAFFTERPAKRLENTPRFAFKLELERSDSSLLQKELGESLRKTEGQRAKGVVNSNLEPDKSFSKTIVAFDISDEISNQQLSRILEKVRVGFPSGEIASSLDEAIRVLNSNDSNVSKIKNIDEAAKSSPDFGQTLSGEKIDGIVNQLVGSAIQNRCEGQLIVHNAKLHNLRTEFCSFSSIELNNVISSHCNWSGLNLEPQGLKLTNYVSYLDKFYGNAPEAVMDMVTFYGFNHDHLSYAAGSRKLSCLKDNIDPKTVCFSYERYWTDPKLTNELRQTSPWNGKSVLSPTGLIRYMWPSQIKSALTSLELVNDDKSEPGKLYRGLQDLAIAAKEDVTARRELSRFLSKTLFNRNSLPPEVATVLGTDIVSVKVKYKDGTYQTFSAISKDMSFLTSITSEELKLSAMTDVTKLKVDLVPMFNAVDESKASISLDGSSNDFLRGSRDFYVKPDGIVELLKIMAEFEKRFKKIVLDDVTPGKEHAADSKRDVFQAHEWLETQLSSKPELFRREESGVKVKPAETKAPAAA